MLEKKLAKMPYAQAKVIYKDNNNVALKSYETEVIIVTPDGWLNVYGLYSPTTRKHISAFMQEYTNKDYYFAKMLYETEQRYNIKTGEFAPLYNDREDL